MAGDKGERIGGGFVDVTADLSNFDAAMAVLPKKAAAKMDEAMKALQAKAAQTKLELGAAYKAGDLEAQQRLIPIYESLRGKIDSVTAATVRQAQAIQATAAASRSAAAATEAQAKAQQKNASLGAGMNAIWLEQQDPMGGRFGVIEAKADKAAKAAGKVGQEAQRGGMSGAMGLMMMSQVIDDMQYGFRAVVNQIPQVGMAAASVFGASAESAMKFGAVMGIVAVAVNVLINHWDDLMGMMGQSKVLTEAEQMEKLGKATRLTADEQERLNRFKREEKVAAELGGKRPSGEEKTANEFEQVFADFGNKDASGFSRMVSGLVGARRGTMAETRMTDEEKTKGTGGKPPGESTAVDRFFDPIFGAAHKWSGGLVMDMRSRGAKQKEIDEKINDENVERAKKDVAAATFDPLKRKELINTMRKNPGAFPKGAADALDRVIPSKNTKDKEKEDALKEHNRAVEEFDFAIAREKSQSREREDSRLAGAMTGSVGQSYLKHPTMDAETMEAEVKKAMEKAGMSAQDIADAIKGTAKKLKENLDKAVTDRALDRGITEGAARQQLAKEAQATDDKQANTPKSEVMSTGAYLNKLLVASLSKTGNGDDKGLAAQQDTAKATMKFADLAEKWESRGIKVIGKDNPARVAPGR